MGRPWIVQATVAVGAFAALALGAAQTVPPPRFEVVSIRPSGPNANANGSYHMLGTVDPGEWKATGTFPEVLIEYGYGLKAYAVNRVIGLPHWADTAAGEYDITATIPPHARQAQIPLMVRAMLVDRFKLVAHMETRMMPAGTLSLAPGGPKLKPDVACDRPDLPPLIFRPQAQPQDSAAPECGSRKSLLNPDGGTITATFHGVTMAALADFNSRVSLPVLDQTGLKGSYDFSVTYAYAPISRSMTQSQRHVAGDDYQHGMERAYLKQLGLKLTISDPRRLPVPVVVVTHVEQPTAN